MYIPILTVALIVKTSYTIAGSAFTARFGLTWSTLTVTSGVAEGLDYKSDRLELVGGALLMVGGVQKQRESQGTRLSRP